MEAEAKPHPMQDRSDKNLRFGISTSDRSHICGAMLRAEPIHPLLKALIGPQAIVDDMPRVSVAANPGPLTHFPHPQNLTPHLPRHNPRP